MKPFELSIPKPCHENWERMTPEDKGRFCGACQKTVIDFTGMSDAQLAQFFKKPTGPVCGRFDASQINRVVDVPHKRLPWIRYLVAVALPAFLFSKKAAAQGEVKRSPLLLGKVAVCTAPTKVDTANPRLLKPLPLLTISGTVQDENGQPVAHASVLFRFTQHGVVANEKGEFAITQSSNAERELVVSAVGYDSKIVLLGEAEKIVLTLSPRIVGRLFVVRTKKVKTPLTVLPVSKPAPNVPASPFAVYPNPVSANASFTLDAKSLESGTYDLQILSVSGELVFTRTLTIEKKARQSVSTGDLAAGTYVVRLISKAESKSHSQILLVR